MSAREGWELVGGREYEREIRAGERNRGKAKGKLCSVFLLGRSNVRRISRSLVQALNIS